MRERFQLHDRVELLGAVPNHAVRDVRGTLCIYDFMLFHFRYPLVCMINLICSWNTGFSSRPYISELFTDRIILYGFVRGLILWIISGLKRRMHVCGSDNNNLNHFVGVNSSRRSPRSASTINDQVCSVYYG